MEEKYVNLANLCQGGALELFQRELERVLENIADPNTPAGAPVWFGLGVLFCRFVMGAP